MNTFIFFLTLCIGFILWVICNVWVQVDYLVKKFIKEEWQTILKNTNQ